jgi:very-short-patch-repair endonuclease
MNIKFEIQYNIFNKFKVDFAVFYSDKIILIEMDGKQHFISQEFFGGEPQFKKQRERDLLIDKYCKDNKLDMIRIPYWDMNKIQEYLNKIYTINNDILLAPSPDYYNNIKS